MAFKLQDPNSSKRISLPGQPTEKMLASRWIVLDALGNPWGHPVGNADALASADANIERKHAQYAKDAPSHVEKNWLRENALPAEFEVA